MPEILFFYCIVFDRHDAHTHSHTGFGYDLKTIILSPHNLFTFYVRNLWCIFFFVSFVRRPLIFCVKCWCVINKCIKMKKPWKIRNEPYPTFSYVLYKEWKKLKTNEILNIYLKHIFPFLFQFCFWCDEIKTFSVNISQLNAEREEGKKTAHERLSHSHLSKCTHSHNIFVRT